MSSAKRKKTQASGATPKKKHGVPGGNVSLPVVHIPPGMARTGGNFAQLGIATGHEKKFKDTSLAAVAFTTTGVMTLLNGLVPGSDANQRIGRRINVLSLLLRLYIQPGATPTDGVCRAMVVVDKQANGAAPVIGDILTSGTSVNPNNLNNRGRFVTLLDWVTVIDQVAQKIVYKTVFLRKKFATVYNAGTAGTVADIATASLYLVTVGDLAAGATANVITNGVARIRFEDD